MHARPPPSRVRQWAIVLALTALYVAAARLGLALALPPEKKATAVWPPSGIALAAVLLFDRRVWPGIWLGAYLANLWDYFHAPDGVSFSGHAGVAFAIAAGSAAQALLGASLVRRWGNGTEFLDRAEGVFRFLGIALLMCLVSSTVGVASLCLGGFVDRAAVPSTWWTWWLGDTTGVLVLTPLLLAWSRLPLSPGGTKRLPEALLLSGLLLGTSGIAFWDQGSLGAPLAYLTVPVVVWAAFRFGPRGTTAALLLLATVAVWGTAYGRGPFTRGSLTESLWLLQTFVCVLAVTALAVAAVLTEKRYALEQLRLAGDLLRAVADGTTDAVFVKDRAGRYLFFNEAAARFVGRPVEEVLGQDDTALFEPDSARQVMSRDREVMEAGRAETAEETLTAAGVTRIYQATKAPYRDAGGTVVGLVGISRDVTARKRAEEELWRERTLLRTIIDAVPDIMFTKDTAGRFVLSNRAHLALLGAKTEAEVAGKTVFDLHPPHLARGYHEDDLRVLRGGETVFNREELLRDAAGRETWSLVTKTPLRDRAGAVTGLIGLCRDIQDRKRAEAEIERHRAELQLILDTVPALIFYKDRDHRLVRVNRELVRLVGLPREAIEGRTDEDLGSPHAARYYRDEDEVMSTGRPRSGVIEPLSTATGTRLLRTDKLPYWDETGRINGVIGFAVDVTERERAEEELRQVRARLQHVLSSSPAVLFTLAVVGEQVGGIAWVSENVRGMLGFSPEEAAGPTWWVENLHPEDRDRVAAGGHRDLFATGRGASEYRFRHRDGKYRWIRSELRLLRDPAGRPAEVVGSWSDVTGLKQVEEQYRQAQKMEAVGQLAGGVAHDFNNLLTVINGYCDLLLATLPAADQNRGAVAAIREAGERAAGLTQQLLAFSRKAIIEPKVLDLNDLVTQLAGLLRRLIGEDIVLALSLAPGPHLVKVDPGQVEQVLLNLAVNARDAMPTGGRLTIETATVEVPAADAGQVPDPPPGRYVRLAVSDTGCGMTAEVKARIFEPFFTTKEPGKGTGLGLATVYGIVQTYGGRVEVASRVGAGTTFEILLPAAPREAAGPPPPPAAPAAVPRGAETVLLVEDEESVRGVARIALQMQGYAVLEAGGGVEAVRTAGRHPGPIHLLVTDVVMPGIGGREVAEAVRQRYPGLRVLYTSGYTDDAVVRHGIVVAADAFLQKPFTPFALARKVREILDRG